MSGTYSQSLRKEYRGTGHQETAGHDHPLAYAPGGFTLPLFEVSLRYNPLSAERECKT